MRRLSGLCGHSLTVTAFLWAGQLDIRASQGALRFVVDKIQVRITLITPNDLFSHELGEV